MSDIKIEYRGETITYNEPNNEWYWQGSRRGLISLEKARESIDRALDGSPNKPKFQRQKAIYQNHRGWIDAEVTSQDGDRFWLSYDEPKSRHSSGGKKRSQESGSSVFADTTANRAKIEEMARLHAEAEKLRQQESEIQSSMQSFTDWLKSNGENQ